MNMIIRLLTVMMKSCRAFNAVLFMKGINEFTNRMDEIEGLMLDTGNGKIEIFTNLDYEPDTGIIRHFALDVDDAVMYAEKCKAAGYEIFMGPKDINLGGQKGKIAFCFGPLKEQIEFYQLN